MGRSDGRLGFGDRDVRSITASFYYFQSKGEAIDYGKKDSNKKKNRRIHKILLGNFKPAILGKK